MNRTSRAAQWMSRSSLRLALAVSLALHAGFGLWVVLHPRERAPSLNRPGEIWFEELPPPKPVEVVKQPPRADVKPTTSKVATAERPQRTPEAVATLSAPARSDAARSDDVPRAASVPNLFSPQIALSERGTIAVEPNRGETVHPDDPRFSPDVIAAREQQRVKGRVDGWAEDTLADARAQRGLPHPYLARLGTTARAGLDKLAREQGLRAPGGLQARVLSERYSDSAASYAKSGNPELGPPGQAPRPSEGMTQPELAPMRALAQATETFNDLSHGKPLLTLTLSFLQTKDNHSKTAVLKASIDPAFDAFVLQAWPRSVAAAGAPPPDAFRTSELRSIWEIEGWPGVTPLDKTLSYLPAAGLMGVPLSQLIPGAVDGLRYEFRARLLRVY